ncbi:MAG: heavy-metal-associated domain-containing protein [Bacteroidaceae bacterium]|nr:heavy-metal-associated domain-containing protein [Bacteroidaceae bacterium]
MKKTLILLIALMVGVLGLQAKKNMQTVVLTTQPQMHCEGCEKKIKENLRFVKGVKDIQTNVSEQKVTIQYDANKTTLAKIQEGFGKIGYQASEVKPCCQQKTTQCCSGAPAQGCCQAKK